MSGYYHLSCEVSQCDLASAKEALSVHCSGRLYELEVDEDLGLLSMDMMFHNNHLGMSADSFVEMFAKTLREAGITSAHIAVDVWDAESPTDSTSTDWSDGDEDDAERCDECPGCSCACSECSDCSEPRCESCHPDACWRCGSP